MRRTCWLAATLTLSLVLGCGDCRGSTTLPQSVPLTLAGVWTWQIGDLPCPVLDGFLSGSDGEELFTVGQDGNDLSASFVDAAGNQVLLSATTSGDNVSGTFTITAPSPTTPCAGKGYVVNNFDDSVSVIDLATNTEVAVVPVGGNPRGLDITPDGALVFVANRGSDTVTVIRTSDDTVVATIPITGFGEPYNVEATPDGTAVYVVNKNGDDVSVLEVATLTEQVRIPLSGSSPEGLAITPDGALVFAVNRGSGTVDVIATPLGAVVGAPLAAPSDPRDATVLPDGSKVYVVGEGGLLVFPVQLVGGSAAPVGVSVAGVRGRDVVASPDGTRVYVAAGPSSGRVHVIDTATDTLVGTIDLSTFGAYGIDLCGDGGFAYVSDDNDRVVVVDLAGMVEADTILVGDTPKWVKLLEAPPPRVLVISFTGTASVDSSGSGVDGNFVVASDSLDDCIGENLDFVVLVDTGGAQGG